VGIGQAKSNLSFPWVRAWNTGFAGGATHNPNTMSEPEYEQYPDGIGISTLEGTNALEDFSSEPPYKVHGVAIPENTILKGGKNVEYFFPPEKAEKAAEVMQEQIDSDDKRVHLVSGFHEIEGQADPDEIVGEVTSAGYEKGVGVVFEGETIEEGVAERISHGYVDVSPTVMRSLGEYDDTMGAQRVDRVLGFRDVAVVGNGQPGASIEPGGNPAVEALSLDALSRGFDVLQDGEGKTVAGVTFTDTGDGELDESEIPSEDFESHYLYPGDTKSESSYPVVDGDGVLRKGNVEAAWSLGARGDIDADEHDRKLMALGDEFENPPEFAQNDADDGETDSMSDDEVIPVVESVPVKERAGGKTVTLKET
jgi:hypothetical protein